MKTFIYPWNERSQGARALSEALGISRIKHQNSQFKGSPQRTVINWGASEVPPEVAKCRVLNTAKAVDAAASKRNFFQLMQSSANGPRTPEFTTNAETALEWAKAKQLVVARTKDRARSGTDIVFFDNLDKFLEARLYTKYIKKKEEYRVHIVLGTVVTLQQKVLRQTDDAGNPIDPDKVDFRIRNLSNGFIFQRNNLHPPKDVIVQAELAMRASGLDFGAVDVIWNEHQQKAYVLEINTAPGIEGTTVDEYVGAFKKL